MRNTRGKRRHAASGVGQPAAPAPTVSPARGRRRAVVLVVFALVFGALAVNGYTRTSATWDEPIHVTSGYAALAHQDYRIDPSHPPFLRMWAAVPVVVAAALGRIDPRFDAATVDRASAPAWFADAYEFAHRFLYVDNDADRLLYAGRFMVVLLGILLGVFLFHWTEQWLGWLPAVGVLALYTLEPNLAAHSTLVTTDLAVTCFMFGAVYFLWRTCAHLTRWNLAGLTACVALAMVTKFSAIVLAPIVALLLGVTIVRQRAISLKAALGIACLLAVATFAAIWAAYGFRYEASAAGTWSFELHRTGLARSAPALAGTIEWIDARRLLPNAFTQGFLYNQASVQQLGMFLAGRYSTEGWWYYFPFAFLIKTPIVLLALTGVGIVALLRRRADSGSITWPFLLVPVAVYLSVAMASGVNIGLRHILPIYPFVLLVAAAGLQSILAWRGPCQVRAGEPDKARPTSPKGAIAGAQVPAPQAWWRRGPIVAGALGVLLVAEFATAYPYTLTFFNQLAGGPRNGYRYLADSNLGWGQNLKTLKAWMDRNGVSHVNLAYFGQADPAYYGIDCTYLPGSPSFALASIARPRLPGYVAISSTVLNGVYLQPWWRLFYRPFEDLAPVTVVGNSIRVYWVERWPEATGRYGEVPDVEAHRILADALLFGQQWPTRAVRHYREYLRRVPNRAGAMVNAGIALAASGEADEALAMLRRAVHTDPDHGDARLTLAKALFGAGDLDGANEHAERAVALRPDAPDAHDLLGRVRAVQGRLSEAAGHFRQAIAIDPEFEPAREHLGRLMGDGSR